MSRKQYSKELKLKLVKQHIEDGVSYWKLGKENGIEASIIRRWGQKYETFGEDGLEKQNADLCNYSAEFKKKIVHEYLEGNITSQDLAAKYKIHAPTTVRAWVKQYNSHIDLTDSRKEGVYHMVKKGARKKTTLEERIRNSFYVMVLNFPKSVGMILLYAVPVGMIYLAIMGADFLFPMVFLFGIAAPGYGAALLYKDVFKKLEPKEEEITDDMDFHIEMEEEDTNPQI